VDRFEPSSSANLNDEFDIELKRELPEAYKNEINAQQARSRSAIQKVASNASKLRFYVAVLISSFTGARPVALCSQPNLTRYSGLRDLEQLCAQDKLDRKKITNEIRNLSTLLTDIVLNELSRQSELRGALRQSQFQALTNVILKTNSAQLTASFVEPSEDRTASEIRLLRSQNRCAAILLWNALLPLEALDPNFLGQAPSLQDREKMRGFIRDVGVYFALYPATFAPPITCPVLITPIINTCSQVTQGSREYFRTAAASGLHAVNERLAALGSSVTSLSVDDWRLARNTLLGEVLAVSDFNLQALTAPSACNR